MAELVRDDVLVEFVRVFGEIRGQHDVLHRGAAVKKVSPPGLSAAQSTISAGKLVVGRDAEHRLDALVDGIEHGERRRSARAGDRARGVESGRNRQLCATPVEELNAPSVNE